MVTKQSSHEAFLTQYKTQKNWKNIHNQMNIQKIEKYYMRRWLKIRGKSSREEKFMKKDLHEVFKLLDRDKSGTLCLEELYEPLLSLGLVDSTQEVEKLINNIGSKTSGTIEFHEFLRAFDSVKGEKSNLLRDMEKKIVSKLRSSLPIGLILSTQKRSLMLNAYLGETPQEKEKGMKVIRAMSNLEVKPQPSKIQRIMMRRKYDFTNISNRIARYNTKSESMLNINIKNLAKSDTLPRICLSQKLSNSLAKSSS